MKKLYFLIFFLFLSISACDDDQQIQLEAGTIVFASPNCNDFIIETTTGRFKPTNLRQEFEMDQLQVLFSFNLTSNFHDCSFLGDLPIIEITSMRQR
ncbi:MAG: hypothetical protein ACPGJS_05775 [Flammeovirgaceae bacterium]